jgi:hypothetical protein
MNNLKNIVVITATASLVLVVVAMVVMFVIALLDTTVDDKIVFDIVGPAFQTIVGGFIGLITGIKIGEDSNEPK